MHPDMVHSYGADVAAVNENALQDFFRLWELLRGRYELAAVAAGQMKESERLAQGGSLSGRPEAAKARYSFAFFSTHKGVARGSQASAGADSTSAAPAPAAAPSGVDVVTAADGLTRVSFEVSLSPVFEEQMRLLTSKGMSNRVAAHWLAAAAAALQKFADAAGVALVFQLGSPHAELIGDGGSATGSGNGSRRRGDGSGFSSVGAMEALRLNLVAHSPLVQGKGDPFPERGLYTTSAFSRKEVEARVLLLLGREPQAGGVTVTAGVDRAQARAAMRKLFTTFSKYHDALQLYHAVWPSLRLHVSGSGHWYADPATRSLYLPHDFEEDAAASFIQTHFPRLLARAQADMGARMRETGVKPGEEAKGGSGGGGGGAAGGSKKKGSDSGSGGRSKSDPWGVSKHYKGRPPAPGGAGGSGAAASGSEQPATGGQPGQAAAGSRSSSGSSGSGNATA